MQNDIKAFVGNLDSIVPELINDPIYSSRRLHKNSKPKDLWNLKAGDIEGDDQYKWWNSETQSNWRDGFIRNMFLLEDKEGIKKAKNILKKSWLHKMPMFICLSNTCLRTKRKSIYKRVL